MLSKTDRLIKGAVGELGVINALDTFKDKYYFRYLYNVSIPKITGDGFTQVDFILMTTNGYFLVDMKNWSGTLYCDPDAICWDLVAGKTLQLHVLNPYRQGVFHELCFGWLTEMCAKSLVVYSNELEVHNPQPYMFPESNLEELLTLKWKSVSKDQLESDYQKLLKIQRASAYDALAFYWWKRVNGKWS